jgi:regulator of PEP synthase PpsR (kinase-PPPase family)
MRFSFAVQRFIRIFSSIIALFCCTILSIKQTGTGKTPLSVYLAQTMGLRVANVPLVVDLDPPKQLATVNPKRVFCLLLDVADLHKIRKVRLQGELQGRAKNDYADKQYLRRDLKHARDLAVEYGFTEIDVSNRAVEETASFIRSVLKERFGE